MPSSVPSEVQRRRVPVDGRSANRSHQKTANETDRRRELVRIFVFRFPSGAGGRAICENDDTGDGWRRCLAASTLAASAPYVGLILQLSRAFFFVGRWSVFVSLLFPDRWILSRSRSRRWTSRDVVVATDGSRALKPPPSADHAHRSVAEILFDPVGPFLLPSSSSFHVWFFFSRTFVRLCVSVSFFLYRRRNAREGIH